MKDTFLYSGVHIHPVQFFVFILECLEHKMMVYIEVILVWLLFVR